MTALRSQVFALGFLPVQPDRSGDEANKLEQMEQAANDPLFMADLRETMSAFLPINNRRRRRGGRRSRLDETGRSLVRAAMQ